MKKLRELLRTNRWFAVVLLLEAAVLASLAASLFGAPYKLQLTPADFSNDYPQIAAVNEDGTALQIWNNSEDFTPPEDKAISFSTAGSAMRSGAYEVTVQYFSCQMPDARTFNALYSAGSLSFASKGNPSAISADAVTLDDCHRTVTTRLWVGYGARMQDLTATLTYGEGQLYLYGITLTEQPIYRLTRLVIFVLLAAVLDLALLLLFARGDTDAPARRRKYAVPLILAGITVAACLPLFSNYLYFGHDLDYHLQRISAMAAELSYGQFPVRMTTDTLNGYGYANSLCYCELFLTLPALLYNAWLPLRTCYQVYIFAVTLSTAIIAYCSFGKITASRKLGLLGAALYTLSCYRLVCTYIRASVGEYTAITFLPLVLVGLYNIYTTEKPRFAQWAPMAFGMAALVQCHLLSCELIALLLVVFCLLRLRDTLRPACLLAWVKAALLAVAGICVMLWPAFTGHRLQADTDAAAQEFLADRGEPEQQHPELLAALQAYNQRIYAEKQSALIDLESCEEPAADLTAYGIEDEIIGVLEIPAMELTMPVYLGALDDHLAAGAAVLGNTSAPIGGDNANSVIAGHRGWRGADYFRHINRLQVGDTVKLTNLWEILTYTVTDIQIIQPHEVDKIKIQQSRDLLTLITCHPYASGGRQRYVVCCERVLP